MLYARAHARTVRINESLSGGHTFPFECTGLLMQVFGLLLLSETVCFISIFRHKHVDPVSIPKLESRQTKKFSVTLFYLEKFRHFIRKTFLNTFTT